MRLAQFRQSDILDCFRDKAGDEVLHGGVVESAPHSHALMQILWNVQVKFPLGQRVDLVGSVAQRPGTVSPPLEIATPTFHP
jgi:hypothetical protein